MATIRRTTARASVSSRMGDMLMRRRGEKQVAKKASTERSRTLDPENPTVVEVSKQETPLMDLLDKARYELRAPRLGEYIHVSDLLGSGKCTRKTALKERFGLSVAPQNLSLTDSLTFAQGDAIHDVLKGRAARGGPRSVWGTWKCACGTTRTKSPCLLDEVDQTVKCSACNSPQNIYEEVPMRDKELMIVGTPDLILYLHAHEAFYVTELKSIAHEKWKELVRPDPEHVMQVLFYWYLMHRKGYRLANRVSILYATKGWMFSGTPCKEFSFDAQSMLHRLEPYLEDAKALKESRSGGALPMRICASERAPVAQKCEACSVCFKGSDETPKKVNLRAVFGTRAQSSGDRPVAAQHRIRIQRKR